jgi:hypothetical protein
MSTTPMHCNTNMRELPLVVTFAPGYRDAQVHRHFTCQVCKDPVFTDITGTDAANREHQDFPFCHGLPMYEERPTKATTRDGLTVVTRHFFCATGYCNHFRTRTVTEPTKVAMFLPACE